MAVRIFLLIPPHTLVIVQNKQENKKTREIKMSSSNPITLLSKLDAWVYRYLHTSKEGWICDQLLLCVHDTT